MVQFHAILWGVFSFGKKYIGIPYPLKAFNLKQRKKGLGEGRIEGEEKSERERKSSNMVKEKNCRGREWLRG